jgi:hypothetical protein
LEAKGADLSRPAEAPEPGRHHPGMVGDIISEPWAELSRNGGRHHSGIVGDIDRSPQAGIRVFLDGDGVRHICVARLAPLGMVVLALMVGVLFATRWSLCSECF